MNKIIPFNKEIKFDECIGEITSIAIDDTLKFMDEFTIGGELIVRGCRKLGDIEEDFSYPIPTSIAVDNKYDTSKASISVDDFYYEIINEDTLKDKIDLILDNLFFKEKEITPIVHELEIDDEKLERNEKEEIKEEPENVQDLFKETPIEKEYSIYRVYLVGMDDGLEDILEKYHITKEELSLYNDIDNIKPGTKLIIPSTDE